MTLDAARKFILSHPNAAYKGDPKHTKYLEAVEVIETAKRCKINEWAASPTVLDNPHLGRMRR